MTPVKIIPITDAYRENHERIFKTKTAHASSGSATPSRTSESAPRAVAKSNGGK